MTSRYNILRTPSPADAMQTPGSIPLVQHHAPGYSRVDGHEDLRSAYQSQNSSSAGLVGAAPMKFNHLDADGIEVVPQQPGLELSPQGHPGSRGREQPPGYFGYNPRNPQYLQAQNSTTPEKKIAGLRPRSFWAVTILLVLIVGVAIGAGIGGGLAAQNNHKSSQSFSQPISNTNGTSSPLFPTSGCPAANGTITFPLDNKTGLNVTDHGGAPLPFLTLCNTSYPVESNQFTISDIFHVYEPTLYDCIQACALFNEIQSDNRCAGVGLERFKGGYCYLKNTTLSSMTQGINITNGYQIDSAVLVPLDSL